MKLFLFPLKKLLSFNQIFDRHISTIVKSDPNIAAIKKIFCIKITIGYTFVLIVILNSNCQKTCNFS